MKHHRSLRGDLEIISRISGVISFTWSFDLGVRDVRMQENAKENTEENILLVQLFDKKKVRYF